MYTSNLESMGSGICGFRAWCLDASIGVCYLCLSFSLYRLVAYEIFGSEFLLFLVYVQRRGWLCVGGAFTFGLIV